MRKQETTHILINVLFLIFYMVMGFALGYTFNPYASIKNIDISKIQTVDRQSIQDTRLKVLFSKPVMEVLNLDYNSHTTEYHLCLMGQYEDGKYIITTIYPTRIDYSDSMSVKYTPCPRNTLVSLHNHPRPLGSCELSDQDIKTFEENVDEGFATDYSLEAVQCNTDEFGIYRLGNYEEKLKWGIYEEI